MEFVFVYVEQNQTEPRAMEFVFVYVEQNPTEPRTLCKQNKPGQFPFPYLCVCVALCW
jgi:hypothetical protein